MIVELDVFSGKPNPRWKLDDKSAASLRRLQSALRRTEQAPPEPPGLGYRGFSYEDPVVRARVYRGFVRTARGVFADPSFRIERFLIETVPPEFAQVAQTVRTALGAK